MKKNVMIIKIRSISEFIMPHPVKIYLQYTYCPISHEVKVTTEISSVNRIQKIFFLKSHLDNLVRELFPDFYC